MSAGRFKVILYQPSQHGRLYAGLEHETTMDKANQTGRYHCLTTEQGEAEILDQRTGERFEVDYLGNIKQVNQESQGSLMI